MTSHMTTSTFEISVKGRRKRVPLISLDGLAVVVRGAFVRVAEIFDEYWLEADTLPDPNWVIQQLKSAPNRPDLFSFAQRVPDTTPRFGFHLDWDNVAVIPVSSHEHWFNKQISSASRRNIRASEKKGVVVRVSEFDEEYIKGIMSIYNESPIRHGRKYGHYGKAFSAVQEENGTYRARSTFLAAYLNEEFIGYMKIVWDKDTAAIMQIVSKMGSFDKRPNNALLSEAVKLCVERQVKHLQYERYVYGKKLDSSLTRFKRENGFVRMDLPRYYVPLTTRGKLFLSLGLHRDAKDRLPQWLTNRLLSARDKWYAFRSPSS